MKKVLLSFVILFLLLVNFSACELLINNKDGTNLDLIQLTNSEITIEKNNISYKDVVSFRDDNYYYFVFDLGRYHNIPVDVPYGYCTYSGIGEITRTMTASSATSNEIKNSATKSIEENTEVSFSETLNVDVSFGYEPPSSIGGVSSSISIENGYAISIGKTDTLSWSNSYSEAETYSESTAKTTTIAFKTGDPAGNYYYYLSIDIQAYGVIIKNVDNNSFYATIYSSVIGRGFNYIYCGNGTLNFSCDDKLDFDLSIVEEFNLTNIIPENYIGDNQSDGKLHVKTVKELYTSLKKATNKDIVFLDNDIDCTGFPWMPIDNFSGILDGNGKSIKNLTYFLDNGGTDNNFGIFETLKGTIINVKIVSANINVHKYHDTIENIYAGIICGKLDGGKIELCEISDSNIFIYHDSDDKNRKTRAFVGGYVGELINGGIISCTINSTAIYGKTRINYNTDSKADCWSYVGGVVGHLNGGTVRDCYRNNDVSVKAHTLSGSKTSAYHCHVGGIVGFKDNGSLVECNSTDYLLECYTEVEGGRKANTSSSGRGNLLGN